MMDDIRKLVSKKDDEGPPDPFNHLPQEEGSIENENEEIIDLLVDKKPKGGKKLQAPSSFVKVPFGKFVNLVASHDFESVADKYGEENLVMSTTLLTELANAHPEEEKEQSRIGVFFLVGLAVGIVITFLLVKY